MATSPYTASSAPVSQVYTNTAQEIIEITDDKLRLILKEYLAKVEQKKDWIAPFSIFIAIITVFASSEFKAGLGIPAATWQALFLFAAVTSFVWFVISVLKAFRSPSLDDVIHAIKNP